MCFSASVIVCSPRGGNARRWACITGGCSTADAPLHARSCIPGVSFIDVGEQYMDQHILCMTMIAWVETCDWVCGTPWTGVSQLQLHFPAQQQCAKQNHHWSWYWQCWLHGLSAVQWQWLDCLRPQQHFSFTRLQRFDSFRLHVFWTCDILDCSRL